MRLACTLAIALGLSGTSAPVNAQASPAAAQKAPESAAKKKPEAAPASGTSASGTPAGEAAKRPKRAVPAPDGAPRKIVVRKGGASEPAARIAPGMTPAEAARQRQNAEQLLGSTGDRLKQLAGRVLNAQQQETAAQARNYMEGARAALQEGDLRRASTLAEKAHLLVDDLAKH